MNPGGVAGPYDIKTGGQLFSMLRDEALPAAAPGTVAISHVYDVVAAHLAAVTKGRNGERYLLGSEDVGIVDFIREMAHVAGVDKVPNRAPAFALKCFGRLSVMIAGLTGKGPDMTPEIAEFLSARGTSYCSDKAARRLGYRVRPMADAVRDGYDWLVKEGLLDSRG